VIILVCGLVLFLGIHSLAIVSPATRDRFAARLGEWPWKGLFAVISLAGFVLIVVGFREARLEPVWLYVPPLGLRHVALVLLIPVFPLLLAAYLPGRIRTFARNPLLIATKAWALAHLLANGRLVDVVLFGSFLLWAGAYRVSLLRRTPRSTPALPATPMNDFIVIAAGLALYAWFIYGLHAALFGVSPLALN